MDTEFGDIISSYSDKIESIESDLLESLSREVAPVKWEKWFGIHDLNENYIMNLSETLLIKLRKNILSVFLKLLSAIT